MIKVPQWVADKQNWKLKQWVEAKQSFWKWSKELNIYIKGFKLAHWIWENTESAEQKLIEDFNINHVDIKNYKFKVRDEIVSI